MTKYQRIAEDAVNLYVGKELSVEAVAKELGVSYRTARKAIREQGIEFRDSSARLVGRTRPDRALSRDES